MIKIAEKDIEFGKKFRSEDPYCVKMMEILGNECPLFLKLTLTSLDRTLKNFNLADSPKEYQAKKLFFDIYYYAIGSLYSACGKRFPCINKSEWKSVLEEVESESRKGDFIRTGREIINQVFSSWAPKFISVIDANTFLAEEMYKIIFAFTVAEIIEKLNIIAEAEKIINEQKGSN